MFRIESYITPILWSYFSKYVKNFNSHDFQVSLWNGGAVFSNLDLNLDVLDSELQIPLTFSSGHIQELKITVPWRKITSEPIVLNVKSMELVLKYRDVEPGKGNCKNTEEVLPPPSRSSVESSRNDENAGYIRSLMSKIVSNVRVNFENIVIKYVESDIAFSVNVGEASLTPSDESWNDAFIDRIVYSPDFILRKKLSFSDVNICLDRCNNAGVVDKFHDPMLYRCDFDVRIIQKFATSFSRTPYFYRMDLFLGHLQFCVTDEQIPMLVRLYNLFSWLMQSGSANEGNRQQQNESSNQVSTSTSIETKEVPTELVTSNTDTKPEQVNDEESKLTEDEDVGSWTSWATSWLFAIPDAVFGEEVVDSEAIPQVIPNELEVPVEEAKVAGECENDKIPGGFQLPPSTTHFAVYIKTLTIIFKAVQRICDRSILKRRVVSIYPFLKCSIQGICCDFIARGNENCHYCGVSSIMVHGLGNCTCSVQDCTSSEGGGSSQGGECYFEAGEIKSTFSSTSLFQPVLEGESQDYYYEINHKDYLNSTSETELLDRTPAFFLKYIVTRGDTRNMFGSTEKLQNPEITEVLYHCVAAPCKVLLCSGLVHRLRRIFDAINNYGYEPYGAQPTLSNIPSLRFLSFSTSYPITTYRLVIRQPAIEILAADHPADYGPEKRAEYFRKNGGIVTAAVLPRHSPEWPKMVISWDVLECSSEDMDGHFNRLQDRLIEEVSSENARYKRRLRDGHRSEDLIKWAAHKKAKTATIKFCVKEALLKFISEPVELNVGVKSGSVNLEFCNLHYYNYLDFVHHVEGDITLDSITCSSRLHQRSNVLWLPFTARTKVQVDWESYLYTPSIALNISVDAFSVYIGPETMLTFAQLTEQLSVYLQEFLPASIMSQSSVTPQLPEHTREERYENDFSIIQNFESCILCSESDLPEFDALGICTLSQSIIWQYPQKRSMYEMKMKAQSIIDDQMKQSYIKFEMDYMEDFTGEYLPFLSFILKDRKSKTIFFVGDPQRRVVMSTLWRIRVVGEGRSDIVLLEALAKTLKVVSMIQPCRKFGVHFPELAVNLVNNTYYAGKEIGNSILKSYVHTDGVSPADHVLATMSMKDCTMCYSTNQEESSCTADGTVSINVLDYETLVSEQVIEPVFFGIYLIVPDSQNHCSVSLVTKEINVKIGASLMHSIMYSAALWNQITNSFDSKTRKMVSRNKRLKIILNRVLICNDLNFEIELRYPNTNVSCPEKIPSRDCKAVSCPGGSVYEFAAKDLGVPVEIDLNKAGYSVQKAGGHAVFLNVSNLSASQKLVKVSGSLILANGLDEALEVAMLPHSSCSPILSLVPSRGVGPTHISTLPAIEHFRFRFSSTGNTEPWSECVFASDFNFNENDERSVASVFVTLFRRKEASVAKIQVWFTIVSEKFCGFHRYLVVVAPIYCLRSWLSSETLVHLTSADDSTSDTYKVEGKGSEVEIKFTGDRDVTHHMRFQSSPAVAPTHASVPLLPAGPLLEQSKHAKPIDILLNELTGITNQCDGAADNTELKWPFVLDEICQHDWNTEINPETEIMVSFSPWIEGLPTAVADIRPWALVINLTGIEILFSQETADDEWDQFWVPYKCVFSPKRFPLPSGKFRIGMLMNDFLVKSPSLQFSDQPERLSVQKINKSGKVPIDCYSRLDLFGGSQVACLTIETRICNKILVMCVRPTYSIQNRAPIELYAEGITISAPVTQRRESWLGSRLSLFSTLEPHTGDKSDELTTTAVPILHFTTDGRDYSAETPSYKYLALSCGGPWWFVQLVDCSEVSSDGNMSEGIPGTKIAVTLPTIDSAVLKKPYRHLLKGIKFASEPVVVGSYTKNGQVWVSISQDSAPQLVIHNKTSMPFFVAEKDSGRRAPRLVTPCFEQFQIIPPTTSCHFSFQNAYNVFPQLNKREVSMPDMLLAVICQDLLDYITSCKTQEFKSILDRNQVLTTAGNRGVPSGNFLFPDLNIEWRDLMNVHNNPTQYITIEQNTMRLSVEIVGYTYHLFIEKAAYQEVLANKIRDCLENSGKGKPQPPPRTAFLNEPKEPPTFIPRLGFGPDIELSRPRVIQMDKPIDATFGRHYAGYPESEEDDVEYPGTPPLVPEETTRSSPPLRVKAFIPELYLSIQDDYMGGGKHEREFLGLSFDSVYLEQVPLVEDSKLRPSECPRRESWIYTLRVGNLQVDTPAMSDRELCEFPVFMQPLNRSVKSEVSIPTTGFGVVNFFEGLKEPKVNLDSTVTFTRVTAREINLETAWLKIRPMSVFIEDRFLSYVLPSVQSIVCVFNEGYVLLESSGAVCSVCENDEDESVNATSIESTVMTYISIVDTEAMAAPALQFSTGQFSGRAMSSEGSSLLSRNITFAPTFNSSSSGLNSSNSSIVSSTLSNLRLASVSPPPPSPVIPLEPHGGSRFQPVKWGAESQNGELLIADDKNSVNDDNACDLFLVKRVKVPRELTKLFDQLSHPVRLKMIDIQPTEIELTLRTEKLVYVALDRSVVQLRGFKAFTSVTTDFHLGLELTMHYTVGTIFTIGNPVRVLGSLELLGSPGTLARTVGTGLRDFVVYPYEGILVGPVGFASGLGFGVVSLLRSVTSGTLVSLTNWAQSVSRNIDRLTLDQQEQLITEAARQVELQGFTDGFVQGLSGFGIRILGAIGGLSHHPIRNMLEHGPSASTVIGGVSRGMIGAVAKPIGGVAELIAMTGHGVLLATGWKPRLQVKKPKTKKKKEDKGPTKA